MKPALDGTNVCTHHGGRAPQVQRKAKLRMASLVDPAIDKLARILVRGKDGDALRAAENILDRAGVPRIKDSSDADAGREVLLERILLLREHHTTTVIDSSQQNSTPNAQTVRDALAAATAMRDKAEADVKASIADSRKAPEPPEPAVEQVDLDAIKFDDPLAEFDPNN